MSESAEKHKLEQACTSTKPLRVILYDRYEKSDWNKIMKKQCQRLTETQRNELLKLLKNWKSCSM